jgi:hypothetical protein
MSAKEVLPDAAGEQHLEDDGDQRPSAGDELRMNLAKLKIGEGCLRRNRLLGGAANTDYETYSLPVSRV